MCFNLVCITNFNISRLLIHQCGINPHLFKTSSMLYKNSSFGHLKIYTSFDQCFLRALFIVIIWINFFYFSNKFTHGLWSSLVHRYIVYSCILSLYLTTFVKWYIIYILSVIDFTESRIICEEMTSGDAV